MAVQLKELGNKLSYQEVNDILKLYPSDSEPTTAYEGQIWLDTNPGAVLKRYNGTSWDIVGEVTAENLLSLITNVDGSGSGLDADKLDGQEGSYYQNASNLNAGTIPSARLSASDLLTKIETVDGTDSGLDADKLDGLHGSQFSRSDADTDVSAHTEWQDGYQVRLGSSMDFRMLHDGSNTYMDNSTGQLFIRQLLHGGKIYVEAENSEGTNLYMLNIDPDYPKIRIGGAVETSLSDKTLANDEIFDTGIPRGSVGYFFIQNNQAGIGNGCVYWIGCILTSNNGVNRSGGSTTVWSDTKDSAGLINVYCESTGNLKVQNLSGVSRTLKMGFIGVNLY